MCGIAGVYSTSLSPAKKREKLTLMMRTMRHRGPDGTKFYADDKIGLASSRLGIVDASSDHRLSWDAESRYFLAFNGEIYNHDLLRKREGKGIRWLTRTDTEVVARLASSRAEKALDCLSGDFSIAFWDSATHTGFIARDRLGVKPLYYSFINGGLIFASEIRALLTGFPELGTLSSAAISDYLTYRFVPSPNTAYQKIKKLPAGCWLLLSDEDRAPVTYWDIPFGTNRSDESDLVEVATSLLEKAVSDRITDEVGCGILLSGGLDSSLITAMASRNRPVPIRTYSVVYLDHPNDLQESEHASSRLVSKLFRTDHREISVCPTEFRDAADSTMNHLEDLIADPPSVLRGILCKAAANDGVRVLLSGEGADELFAGYALYSELALSKDLYSGMGRLMSEHQKLILLSPDFVDLAAAEGRSTKRPALPKGLDRLQQMLYTDCKYWLVDDLLLTADKTGMMSSVEVRVPFLDQDVVSFTFSLDSQVKLSSPLSKAFLRRVAEPYLPPAILDHGKRGFPLPLGFWLRGALSDWTNQLIMDSLIHRGYFRRRELRRFMASYFNQESDRLADHTVWSLIVLELFLQRQVAARSHLPLSYCHDA